jgi:hypothetical protein
MHLLIAVAFALSHRGRRPTCLAERVPSQGREGSTVVLTSPVAEYPQVSISAVQAVDRRTVSQGGSSVIILSPPVQAPYTASQPLCCSSSPCGCRICVGTKGSRSDRFKIAAPLYPHIAVRCGGKWPALMSVPVRQHRSSQAVLSRSSADQSTRLRIGRPAVRPKLPTNYDQRFL